jgi:ferredoxin-NADP reductase
VPEATHTVLVRQVRREAEGINSYELVDPDGGYLPPFTAGAHIDLYLSGRAVRQYSLCNDPAERHRYLIAVLVEETGKGASSQLHAQVRAGDRLLVSAPRNRFPLVEGAAHYLLLAGGIGVTPLLSMTARLAATDADFTLHFCTRSPGQTPFRERLAGLARDGRVIYHHDGGDPAKGLDIGGLLAAPRPGTALYYCGPLGFMRAVRESCAHWPEASVHCEYFMPEAPPETDGGLDRFEVEIAGTGEVVEVGPGRSLFAALRGCGLMPPEPCAAADCGLCRLRYREGDPVHRDRLLTDSERAEFVIACVAGSRSPRLVLKP